MTFIINPSDDILIHHGIPGQKWGQKNGPPYPLGSQQLSDLEKRRSAKNLSHPDVRYTDIRDSRNIELPENFKKSDLRYDKTYMTSLKNIALGKEDSNYLSTVYQGIKYVNNIESNGYKGRVFNCRNCALGYEARVRGYDVEARKRPDGSNAEDVSIFFKDSKLTNLDCTSDKDDYTIKAPELSSQEEFKKEYRKSKVFFTKTELSKAFHSARTEYFRKIDPILESGLRNFQNELLKQPNGSRGIIEVGWIEDFYNLETRAKQYHAMNYSVIDGSVIIIDTEGRRARNMVSTFDEYFLSSPSADPRDLAYMRTDDKEFNDKIGKAVKSRR